MYLLAYVSTAVKPLTEEELTQLLKKSRQNNLAENITGLLLYNDSNFLQILEGQKDAVLALLARIQADPRHHCLIVVLQEEHPQREFTDWAMGFQKIDSSKAIKFPGYTTYHDLPMTSEQFLLHPEKSLGFLIHFKNLVHEGDYSQVQNQ